MKPEQPFARSRLSRFFNQSSLRLAIVIGMFAALLTSAAKAATNLLAFHLLKGAEATGRVYYNTKVEDLVLDPIPVLADSDFLAFSTNDPAIRRPTFKVKAEAAERLHDRLTALGRGSRITGDESPFSIALDAPFVLVASGEPIYAGMFSDPNSAYMHPLVPTISHAPGNPAARTQLTNGVTFTIEWRGNLATNFTQQNGMAPPRDMRNDKRILEAIKKLGL